MPSSAYSTTPCVQIRIIRDNKNSLKDEIFTINKATHNDWRINHRSAFSASNSTMYVRSRSEVLSYLYTLFDLLKMDDERYEFVQLDATCYPVVMVSRADILGGGSDTLYKLVRVVENSLDNWPASVEAWSAGEST
jgi:hypothetical protein